MATAATPTQALMDPMPADAAVVAPSRLIVRDIARGGLTGALVGLVGCGLGGRLVMRLAALLVPEATGSITENGNTIGTITLDGSAFLVLGGLFVGLLGGTIWVVISPWIPGTGLRRAFVTMPIAVGLGAAGLVDGDNPDFAILGHDPIVVASLVGLVAIIGFGFAMVDSWLDRHLPPASARRTWSSSIYELLTVVGGVLIAPLVVFAYASSSSFASLVQGLLLGVVAFATLFWWSDRLRSKTERSARQWLAGRLALIVAVAFGYVTLIPDVFGALGA